MTTRSTATRTPRRAALVTGASRGLGRTLSGFLAASGFDLVIDARGADDLAAAASALRAHGTAVIAVPGDVTDATHRERLVAAASDLGGLDLLVNNASTLGASPLPHLVDASPDTLRRTLEVNLIAPLSLVRAAVPLLERRGALIVSVSSDAALGAYEGWGAYGASKAALDLATRTLAAELAPRGIGAVAVDPGDMRTALHQLAFPGERIDDRPDPDVTLPFWAWLTTQDPAAVSGQRFLAQDDVWTTARSGLAHAPVVL